MKLSREYAKCENKERTINALKTAYPHTYEIDHFKPGKYTSIFADKGSYSVEGFTKNFETSRIDWLKKTMEDKVFDFIRKTDEFQHIMFHILDKKKPSLKRLLISSFFLYAAAVKATLRRIF